MHKALKDIPVQINDLTLAYRRKPVLWDIDLTVPKGVMMAIIGPNGAGKSSLIKSMLSIVKSASGSVYIFGESYKKSRSLVSYVPQRTSVDWDFPTNALDVVMMGLYGYLGWIKRPGKKERAMAYEALEKVDMLNFASRQISQLSGGQQQRVFLARSLVQDAKLYIMDEPFAGVDAATERAIISILKELKTAGKTVLVVHHDLQTIKEYFDYVTFLNIRVIASGKIEDVFTEDNLKLTYGGKISFLSSKT